MISVLKTIAVILIGAFLAFLLVIVAGFLFMRKAQKLEVVSFSELRSGENSWIVVVDDISNAAMWDFSLVDGISGTSQNKFTSSTKNEAIVYGIRNKTISTLNLAIPGNRRLELASDTDYIIYEGKLESFGTDKSRFSLSTKRNKRKTELKFEVFIKISDDIDLVHPVALEAYRPGDNI